MVTSHLLVPGDSTSFSECYSFIYLSFVFYSLYDVVIVGARSSRTEGSQWLVLVLLIVF